MRHRLPLSLLAALSVAACQVPEGLTGPPSGKAPGFFRLLAESPLAVAALTVDSELATNPAANLRDGNQATLWANAPYRAAQSWIQLDFGAVAELTALTIKAQPTGATGSSYAVLVSADGAAWTTALTDQRNATWNVERKALPAGTRGRYLKWVWTNSQAAPEAHTMVFEIGATGEGSAPASAAPPSPGASPAASPSPSAAPQATPTPAPTAPASAAPTPEAGSVPDPGPNAARGRALVNGLPVAGIGLQIQGPKTVNVTTDANGYFTATGLPPGQYRGYYYNDSDRFKIGYWRSLPWAVSATAGARIPPVDLYQVGMTNTPKMDARVGLPAAFTWVPQKQPVLKYWFRVHTKPYTVFELMFQSAPLPGDATSYTWSGAGALLPFDPTNRYFWGVKWDAGVVGEGGNLYQAVYFNR